jgi:hypothetical protein
MSIQTDEAPETAPPAHAPETLLHRAIARAIEEFLGTAEGQPAQSIITFAIPGFSESELRAGGREDFDRASAEVAAELTTLLEGQLAEPDLVAAVTEAMERFRVKSFNELPESARAYNALADTVDATVYYNRGFRPPPPGR